MHERNILNNVNSGEKARENDGYTGGFLASLAKWRQGKPPFFRHIPANSVPAGQNQRAKEELPQNGVVPPNPPRPVKREYILRHSKLDALVRVHHARQYRRYLALIMPSSKALLFLSVYSFYDFFHLLYGKTGISNDNFFGNPISQ